MADMITINASGQAEAAFLGGSATTWHGLGGTITAGMTREEMLAAAGITFEIKASPVQYGVDDVIHQSTSHVVLYRTDTGAQLGVVGADFHPTQPREALDFVADVAEKYGLDVDAIMSLRGGSTMVFTAKIPNSGVEIIPGDVSNGFFIFGFAYDGTMRRTAYVTDIRVVCANTLRWSLRGAKGNEKAHLVRQKHRAEFDPDMMAQQMGFILDSRQAGIQTLQEMSQVNVATEEAQALICRLLGKPLTERTVDKHGAIPVSRPEKDLLGMFLGVDPYGQTVPGQDLGKGTLYGLLNGVTRKIDHVPTNNKNGSDDLRVTGALFGQGAKLKDDAFSLFAQASENKGDNPLMELIRLDAKVLS